MNKVISIIGLGKLGLPLATIFASRGHKICGVDKNLHLLEDIHAGKALYYEKGLLDLLTNSKQNLSFSSNTMQAVIDSDISFIVVPTPSNDNGSFSLRYILQSCKEIGQGLKEKKNRHTVVIVSTVSPQSMDTIMSSLERASGKICGVDFGLCYSPEFIALGNAIYDFTHPSGILIGESDKKSGDIVQKVRKSICENNPIITRTNFINAEIAKLALNTYVTTKISFSNMIARVSEKSLGADSDMITNFLGNDPRIGNLYFKGGLAYGGPCFPRDNKAMSHFLNSVFVDSTIPETVDTFNHAQNTYLYEFVLKKLGSRQKTIGVLGLTYKTNTNVIDESPGLHLANRLSENGKNVMVYDPAIQVKPDALHSAVTLGESVSECIEYSSVIIITTPWAEFKKIDLELFRKDKVLIDCWRLFEGRDIQNRNYIVIGNSSV